MSNVAATVPAQPHRFDVHDYYRMAEAGILKWGANVELLDGEIVEMSPIGIMHAAVVDRIADVLGAELRGRARLRIQNPVRLDLQSEPEPDFAILHLSEHEYTKHHPTPSDVMVLIEVSDSTRDFDLGYKAGLYARAEIPEYWLVDLKDNRLRRFTQPSGGQYQHTEELAAGDRIAADALPDISLNVTDLLPPTS